MSTNQIGIKSNLEKSNGNANINNQESNIRVMSHSLLGGESAYYCRLKVGVKWYWEAKELKDSQYYMTEFFKGSDPLKRPTSDELADSFCDLLDKLDNNIVDNSIMEQLMIADECKAIMLFSVTRHGLL
ncbi:hypothetical protein Glove_23g69 [Diversispora epigaea]|uniref:Uncharacterized protein n=1 Tax=Diversispora epigaea TaxID=1348612 RepID=A0A397JQU9_9GLOM|nr:hypothetical protein Glove_23g69 [Diversispora epigaea]